MIDSITLKFPPEAVTGLRNRVPGKIKQWDTNTRQIYLGNIDIHQNHTGISLRGSLAKYWHGNNMTRFTRLEVEAAIKQLENVTGLDFSKAEVTSLEIGFCITLKHSVNNYVKYISFPRRYDLHLFGKPTGTGGLEFIDNGQECSDTGFEHETSGLGSRTGDIKFSFYDKTKEMQDKRKKIPDEFRNKNVMRLEYKLKRGRVIQRKLGKHLTAYDLFDPDIYRELQKLFFDFYKSIPKMGRPLRIESLEELRPVKFKYGKSEYCLESKQEDLKPKMLRPARVMELWAYYQRHQNHEEFYNFLQTLAENQIINSKTFSTVKSVVWKEDLNYKPSEVSDTIFELDFKVQAALAAEASQPLGLIKT